MLRTIALWIDERLHVSKLFASTAGHTVPASRMMLVVFCSGENWYSWLSTRFGSASRLTSTTRRTGSPPRALLSSRMPLMSGVQGLVRVEDEMGDQAR